MTYAHHKAPAHHFRLDEAAWVEIGAAYMAGATGAALGAQWKVSASTIYRQAKLRGWSKRRDASDMVRAGMRVADAAAPVETKAADTDMDPIARWTRHELYEPALIARIAASASGGAFLQQDTDASIVFGQIALLHMKLAQMRPDTEREIVLDALLDRAAADRLFSFTRRDGEEELKRAYWDWRRAEDRQVSDLRDRVRVLEARLRELGAEV